MPSQEDEGESDREKVMPVAVLCAEASSPPVPPPGEGGEQTVDDYVLPQMSEQLLKLLAAGMTNGTLNGDKNLCEVKAQLNCIYEEAKRLTAVQHRRGRTQRM